MKRYLVLIVIVSAVLIVALNAFGQDEETPAQKMQRQRREQAENVRERFRNMSPEQREKFMAEMEERRKRFQNMSDEERAKLRAEMRERYGSSSRGLGYEQQLKSIKVIEEQVAKLKAAVETVAPEKRSQLRELPQEEREKFRETMMTAMRERYTAIRAIEQELARLRGPDRRATESEARLSELREVKVSRDSAGKDRSGRTITELERHREICSNFRAVLNLFARNKLVFPMYFSRCIGKGELFY